MSKTSTDLLRHSLNGPTMGTRWSALFFAPPGLDTGLVQGALQAAVDQVDAQMSTWKPDSDLMRLNAAPIGLDVTLPQELIKVIRLGLQIGEVTEGAFDIGMGDAVSAWGFGPDPARADQIRAAMASARTAADTRLQIGDTHARKLAPLTLDLNGIAKGHGVDRLAQVLQDHAITNALVAIDGELRALGLRPDGTAWPIAVEAPDPDQRAPHSLLALQDAAVATSGDYRHWVEVNGRRLSHTMDPRRGAPLMASPASVTVVAKTCAIADAWATALMVLGSDRGAALAAQHRIDALFLMRDAQGGVIARGVGPLFSSP